MVEFDLTHPKILQIAESGDNIAERLKKIDRKYLLKATPRSSFEQHEVRTLIEIDELSVTRVRRSYLIRWNELIQNNPVRLTVDFNGQFSQLRHSFIVQIGETLAMMKLGDINSRFEETTGGVVKCAFFDDVKELTPAARGSAAYTVRREQSFGNKLSIDKMVDAPKFKKEGQVVIGGITFQGPLGEGEPSTLSTDLTPT